MFQNTGKQGIAFFLKPETLAGTQLSQLSMIQRSKKHQQGEDHGFMVKVKVICLKVTIFTLQ